MCRSISGNPAGNNVHTHYRVETDHGPLVAACRLRFHRLFRSFLSSFAFRSLRTHTHILSLLSFPPDVRTLKYAVGLVTRHTRDH
jgi:hypothetical protein